MFITTYLHSKENGGTGEKENENTYKRQTDIKGHRKKRRKQVGSVR
jgi:hypothetical protein